MRIISGYLGGRSFDSPGGITHPMSDKMRGALFNSLGDISDLDVIDVFSGSGAIAFESISRGADSAISIEENRNAQKVILKNLEQLEIKDKVKLFKGSARTWLNQNSAQYDLVICDPPYDNLQESLIKEFIPVIKDGGMLILSLPEEDSIIIEGIKLVSSKNYGDGSLVFYRKTNVE